MLEPQHCFGIDMKQLLERDVFAGLAVSREIDRASCPLAQLSLDLVSARVYICRQLGNGAAHANPLV
jgi:hypothetical protein